MSALVENILSFFINIDFPIYEWKILVQDIKQFTSNNSIFQNTTPYNFIRYLEFLLQRLLTTEIDATSLIMYI